MIKNIILAGGCFWCTEAIFRRIKGVKNIFPGYIGGHTQNPTYKDVCTGGTGYAEAISIDYDSKIVSLENILMIFFSTHDPTTLNKQGNDIGTQYRSSIFNNDQNEIKIILNFISDLEENCSYRSGDYWSEYRLLSSKIWLSGNFNRQTRTGYRYIARTCEHDR